MGWNSGEPFVRSGFYLVWRGWGEYDIMEPWSTPGEWWSEIREADVAWEDHWLWIRIYAPIT